MPIFTTFTHQNFITHRGLSCSVQCLLTYTGNVWGTFHYCFHTRKRQRAWGFVRHDESITTGTQKTKSPQTPPGSRKVRTNKKNHKKYFLLFYEVFSVFMTFCSIILGRIFCVTAFLYARVVLPFGFLLFHSQHIYFGVGPSFLNFRSTVCCLFACLCFLVNCQQ